MRITKQHPHIAMSAYQSDLRDAKAALEKATNRLVTKVMKAEVGYAGTLHETLPSHLHSVFGYREQSVVIIQFPCSQAREDLRRSTGEGDCPSVTALGHRDD